MICPECFKDGYVALLHGADCPHRPAGRVSVSRAGETPEGETPSDAPAECDTATDKEAA